MFKEAGENKSLNEN